MAGISAEEFITLVGELVIAGAGTRLLAERAGNSELIESTLGSEGLVEQIRDSALKLRMVPIGETFTRFSRVVRDLSAELGKKLIWCCPVVKPNSTNR